MFYPPAIVCRIGQKPWEEMRRVPTLILDQSSEFPILIPHFEILLGDGVSQSCRIWSTDRTGEDMEFLITWRYTKNLLENESLLRFCPLALPIEVVVTKVGKGGEIEGINSFAKRGAASSALRK